MTPVFQDGSLPFQHTHQHSSPLQTHKSKPSHLMSQKISLVLLLFLFFYLFIFLESEQDLNAGGLIMNAGGEISLSQHKEAIKLTTQCGSLARLRQKWNKEQGIRIRCAIQLLTISIAISQSEVMLTCYCMNTVCLRPIAMRNVCNLTSLGCPMQLIRM